MKRKKNRNKNIYQRIGYTILLVFIARLLTNIPIIGANKEVLKSLFKDNEIYNLFDMFSGGGLSNLSMFALSISPYISASIIMQLLGTMFSKIEEIQQEGETGRKKIEKYTTVLAIIMAIASSIAITKQFVYMGVLKDSSIYKIAAVISLIAGTGILIFIGKKITDNGIGNGVSLILTANILSQIPKDMMIIYSKLVLPSENKVLIGAVVVAVMFLIIFMTVKLHETVRRVPLVYSGKLKGRKFIDGDSASLPIKLSPGGVTPVIFTTTLMAFPAMIIGLLNLDGKKISWLAEAFRTQNWFDPNNIKMSVGFLVYVILMIVFSYMYSEIALNTKEIANTLKNQHATIPNVRPGKETEKYLNNIVKGTTLLGAISLILLCLIPMILTAVLKVHVGFGGTSVIIVVSVLAEIASQAKIELEAERYNNFIFQ